MNSTDGAAWHLVVDTLTPYVVRIWTPQGSGTGFIVSNSKTSALCAVATADHVVNHAHYWEEPIRIEHQQSGKTVLLRSAQRAITNVPASDTAAVVFERGDLELPFTALPLCQRTSTSSLASRSDGWAILPFRGRVFVSSPVGSALGLIPRAPTWSTAWRSMASVEDRPSYSRKCWSEWFLPTFRIVRLGSHCRA